MGYLQSPLKPQVRPWLRRDWVFLPPQVPILKHRKQEKILGFTILDTLRILSMLGFVTGQLDLARTMVMPWKLHATLAPSVFMMLLTTRDGGLVLAPIGFMSSSTMF
jgi:hypothetical protein